MSKIVFYIPAIIVGMLSGFMLFVPKFEVSWYAFAWIALFIVSGVLLSKGLFWGGFFGLLPAIHTIYLSTIDTGQIINELPIGIVLAVFYLACGAFVFIKSRRPSSHTALKVTVGD